MPDPLGGDTLAAFEQTRDLIQATLFDWLTQFEERDEGEPERPPAPHLGPSPPSAANRQPCQGGAKAGT